MPEKPELPPTSKNPDHSDHAGSCDPSDSSGGTNRIGGPNRSGNSEASPTSAGRRPLDWKRTSFWPWLLPLAIFLIITMVEPQFADHRPHDPAAASETSDATGYAVVYTLKILTVTALLVLFTRVFLLHFPWKWSGLAVVVGLGGGVLWIALCELAVEKQLGLILGFSPARFESRSGINPQLYFDWFWPLAGFYLIRFFGLAVVVPLAEELFLRGFFIRFLEDSNWWRVKFHQLGWFPLLIPSIYGVLSHPLGEALAAAAWFGLITWLMVRTRNLWDCVIAHALTNLLLGMYVVTFDRWQLW